MFDSFTESREGSAHGGLRVGSQEPRGGLSQLLLDAAQSLQGSLQALKSPRAGGDADKSHRKDSSHRSQHRNDSSHRGRNSNTLSQSGSVEKQGATLAAWQRFFSHSTPLEEEEEFPLMQRQQAVKEKRQKASGDGSSNCLGWIPRDSQAGKVVPSSQSVASTTASALLSGLKSGGSQTKLRQASSSSRGRQEGSSIGRFSERVSPGNLDRDSARESMDLDEVCEAPSITTPQPRNQDGSSVRSGLGTMSHQSRGSLLTQDSAVPDEVFYDFFAAGGQRPGGRWGHSTAAHGDRLFVFGGVSKCSHSDCFVFHSGKGFWSKISCNGKSSPPATFAAAACASRDTIFLFGGKQNQKHCRRLYSLDTVSLQWKAHKESASAPPACSSHTMTHVGQHGIYTFGGEGRKLSNWVYCLDPDSANWSRVNTLGAPPPPRQGHSAVWDEADSLIIMGGNNNDKIFGDVRILSLSTGYWSEAKCSGALPPARHSHTAVMLLPNLMLLWGGCGEKGAVMNDAYLLNTSTFRWHRLKSIGSPPPGRYCHSCNVVGQRVLLFGGTSAVQSFDSLVGVSVDVGGQLGSLAESLANLTRDSGSGKEQERSELVKLQLGNHMRQRQAQDMSLLAITRAEIAERLFEQERKSNTRLSAEVQQLKLSLKETESNCKQRFTDHARDMAALQRERNTEKYRAQELSTQLQAALVTIQKQEGEAVAIDGYKNMYQRLVEERGALVDRAVDVEYRNKLLEERMLAMLSQIEQRKPTSSSSKVFDPWEQEFDQREEASIPEERNEASIPE